MTDWQKIFDTHNLPKPSIEVNNRDNTIEGKYYHKLSIVDALINFNSITIIKSNRAVEFWHLSTFRRILLTSSPTGNS